MRKIFLLFLLLVSLNCNDKIIGDWEPPTPYNVKFFPSSIKRGEILTITYYMRKETFSESLHDVTIDTNGELLSLTDKETKCLGYVEFGIKIKEGAVSSYYTGTDKTLCYNKEDYESLGIYPNKYVSFKWGEIKCYVPKNAVSSPLKLNFGGLGNGGFSENELIILDDSGNEIR